MNTQKVIPLYDNKLYDDIVIFLNEMGVESEHTRKAYETDIRQFFKLIKGKELEYLTLEDIQLKKRDVELFKQILLENGMARSTINRKISAVRSLLENLKANDWNVNTNFFKKVKWLKTQDNKYGILDVHEVWEMARLAREKEREYKELKYYFILFALDTCLRKQAILKLKWSDFEEVEDGVIVHAIDKGNKEFRQKISKEFYNELLSIKREGEERVFPISVDSINDMVCRLKKLMNIPEERNITFHSIRKAGVTFQYRITGDLTQAMKAAGHSNPIVTMRYLDLRDYGVTGAVSFGNKIDEELYKKVTHEELIKAIENCPKDLQLILNIKLNEIINNKNRQ
ncbi:tyrosine-type recombinase/integrase [Geobacillus thermodenitrificans]|uniref:tyrosine-type recombinase/integrase n=1 Tax=Geobacillus thermodenitrificans TaxID=33940 RepID=UPI003D204845